MNPLAPFVAADHWLFHQLNAVWTSRFLDKAMPLVTDLHRQPVVIYVVFPALVGLCLWRGKARAARVMIATALLILGTDFLTHRAIKPLFHRARPENAGVQVVLREGVHHGYSFPSNHAVNTFAGAAYAGSFYPALEAPLFIAAAIVAYSRVYVGVHFPADVLFGAFLGWFLGALAAKLTKRLLN